MNKIILWDYLKENPGWHTAVELRDVFDIKQQATLRKWLEYPFIASFNPSRGKSYKFLQSKVAEYEAALAEETYVPEPKKMEVKGRELNVPTEFTDERFTIRFPFRDSELADVAKLQIRGICSLGPEFDWVKEAVLSVGNNTLSEKHKKISEALTVVLAMLLRYNTVDFSDLLLKVKESLNPETVEDIRKAELADIMKHHPSAEKPKPTVIRPELNMDQFPEEWLQ